MKKQENISLMKTIAILIVVLYHSMMFYSGDWFTIFEPQMKIDKYIFDIINNFQMPVFVFCSGYLFFLKAKNNNEIVDKEETIKKRFNRLIIPYIFICLLYVIPIAIFFYQISIKDIIKNYILGFSPSQLWFLLMLFWECVFVCVFYKKIKLNIKNLLIISIISLILWFIFSKFNILQIGSAFKYLPFYIFGGYVATKKINNKNINLHAIIVIFLGYALMVILKNKTSFILKTIKVYLQLIISLFEVLLFYNFTIKFRGTSNKIYKLIEKNSFGIYLFHQQIIYFCLYFTKGKLPPTLQISFNFIISLTMAVIITRILRKNKITEKMFGI